MDEREGWGSLSTSSATAVLLLLLLWSGTSMVAAQEPIKISNATELQEVRDDLDADYVLADDIDLSGIDNFEPIGSDEEPFTGTFDGDGHTISNLTIERRDKEEIERIGLLGAVGDEGTVSNVNVTDAEATGDKTRGVVGVLVGRNYGDVTGSLAEGSAAGGGVGGLVGINRGTVSESHADVEVTGDLAGGLVGSNGREAEVRGSSAAGNVTSEKEVGGLIGNAGGEVHDSHATGNVKAKKGMAGGLIGVVRNIGSVHDSYATGDVEAEEDAAGGLVGHAYSRRITNSHATGDVTGRNNVGGLIGFADSGEIANSHATGSVTGAWAVGGFVGLNDESSTIADSYSGGDAQGYAEVGGFVGENKGEVNDSRAEGNVEGESRVGSLVGDLDSGSLVDSRWEENTESVPAIGIKKPGTEFENVTPDTMGKSGEDAGRPPASKPGGEKWNFEAGGVVSSPTVVDGTVYVGSEDGNVYAVDADDGAQEWSSQVGGTVAHSVGAPWTGLGPTVLISPTVAGDVVYTAQTTRSIDDEFTFSVRALDASNGDKIWDHKTDSRITSSPTVSEGTLYVGGSEEEYMYALNASTGEEEWRYGTEGGVTSSPTVVDGTVYIADRGAYVHAIDAETGESEWKLPLGNTSVFLSSPTVVDGTVYVGSISVRDSTGAVHAIDAPEGTERWSLDAGPTVSSPTVADGTLYVGGGSSLYALDALTGKEEWRYVAKEQVVSSPTVADGTVYVGGGKYLHALDASTGEEMWMFEDRNRGLSTSPTVVNGTVYIGSAGGNLYAINAGVSGSSEGSRVLLGTLGHHHTWAKKQAEYIDVEGGLPTSALVIGALVATLLVALVGGALLRRRSDTD